MYKCSFKSLAAIAVCVCLFMGPVSAAEIENAEELMQRQEYQKAVEVYSKLLVDDTQNVHLMFNLGTALSFINDQTRSVEVYKHCSDVLENRLAIKPETIESELLAHVYNNLSKCYTAAEKYDEAISACQLGIKRFPDLSWLYYNLGEAYRLKNQPQLAIDNFQKCLKLDSADMPANLKIVECYYAMQNYDSAGKMLIELAKLYPENTEVKFNLGSVFYKQNKKEEAMALWKVIAEREPDSKFGKISKEWLLELGVKVNSQQAMTAETVECRVMRFAFVKPEGYSMTKTQNDANNSLYMMSDHIFDETAKTTAEVSLSISAQPLLEPLDVKKLAENWQRNQKGNSRKFELLSQRNRALKCGELNTELWEYDADYDGIRVKGATLAFINKNNAILIWLNATPSTYQNSYKKFEALIDSFVNIDGADGR